MTPLPWVHHDGYVWPLPEGHRFPMGKFNLLRDLAVAEGIVEPAARIEPRMATVEELGLVHEAGYVRKVMEGTLTAEEVRRIGLPWSVGLVERTRLEVGGTIAAVEAVMGTEMGRPGPSQSLRTGLDGPWRVACNLAGGTHHAHAGWGSGFCLFNDLAVAAAVARRRGWADVVLVIDLDVHQGDGTAAILRGDPSVFTLSVHCERNFPLRKERSDCDVGLREGAGDEEYLALLREGMVSPGPSAAEPASGPACMDFKGIGAVLEAVEPDLVLYDGGCDVHAEDALGKLSLTDAGIYARDRFVLERCRGHGVPTACVIGGGYAKDDAEVARRHAILLRAARDVLHGR